MLAYNQIPDDVLEKCDFFYDWWRPLFWFIADIREIDFKLNVNEREYTNRPHLCEILIILDKIYGFKEIPYNKKWDFYISHPMIVTIGIDERHRIRFNRHLPETSL